MLQKNRLPSTTLFYLTRPILPPLRPISCSDRRVRLREAEAEADQGEHRRGSKHRRSYTAKEKLWILGVFDSILEDPMVLLKVATFEADPRAKGTPYTTVKVGWAPPLERARISAAAGREHAATLLRIDKTSRKKGKFAEMEAELFSRFKARRARGRKVSGRWLTAMGRQLMQVVHPAQLASFKGGKSWRRRFASRFKIGVRRKTNAKNKTWADTEPILLRYFSTLRRRLQLDDVAPPHQLDDVAPPQGLDETLGEESGEEPEPEDINPQMEEADRSEDGELAALDSSDDDEPGDSLIALAAALLPTGYQVGSPPEAVLLEYKSTSGLELVGRLIAFNWVAVGWSVGTQSPHPTLTAAAKLRWVTRSSWATSTSTTSKMTQTCCTVFASTSMVRAMPTTSADGWFWS